LKKTYKLKTAEVAGQVHPNCSLDIDEEVRTAEVFRPTGLFGKNLAHLENLPFDATTTVQLQGATIKCGSVTLVAGDEAMAKEISNILLGPSRAAERSRADFKGLQDSVYAFLRARQRGIEFLVELKNDPRQASVQKVSTYTGKYENPGVEHIEVVNAELSGDYARMGTFAGSLKEGAGRAAVERVYAFVYAMCSWQDELVRSGGPSKETKTLVEELGLQAKPEEEPKAGFDLESLLQSASQLFSP